MSEDRYTAFAGHRLLAAGGEHDVAAAASAAVAAEASHVLIFRDATGEQVEVDPFSPTPTIAHAATASPAEKRLRGRPRLGVTAREVTLLPRHWDWLATQPGGASAALRRLVEQASRAVDPGEATRQRRHAICRAMTSLGGDLPGYEGATRALFSGDLANFLSLITPWPHDVRDYLWRLATET